MYFVNPENKRQLTSDQIVSEMMTNTIGGIGYLFSPGVYKQPENPNSNTSTQQQLKTFIKTEGNATQVK